MEMLGLHNLKVSPGSKTRKRRVGRGNASGKGNYSGRGMKGQRARSGGKAGLKLKGIKGYLQKIPKSKGFHSLQPRREEVNLRDLEKVFAAGEVITPKSLLASGLVKTIKKGIKVLGQGELKKKLEIEANAFSKTAEKAIIKAGGKITIIDLRPKKPAEKDAGKRIAK